MEIKRFLVGDYLEYGGGQRVCRLVELTFFSFSIPYLHHLGSNFITMMQYRGNLNFIQTRGLIVYVR